MTSAIVRERWLAGSKRGEKTLFPEDRNRIDRDSMIFKLLDHNPKHGRPRERFALFYNGMSVERYVEAVVGAGGNERVALEDICWDWNHEFIELQKPSKAWSVADAKAKLSEILSLARAGEPQTIGLEDPCVVVSAAQFEQYFQPEHLGRFLVESAPRGYELELPTRADERGDAFAADENGRAA